MVFSGEKLMGLLKAGWHAAGRLRDELASGEAPYGGRMVVAPFAPGAGMIPEFADDDDGTWGDASAAFEDYLDQAGDLFAPPVDRALKL